MFKELFLPLKNKKKEIKLTSLEEELKRLKSSLNNQNNKSASISYALNKSEDPISKQELKVNFISKTYNKRKVVNKVSLKLNRGEAVGLLGPNGAGKTTCFYMIAGLIDTDEGDIIFQKKLTIKTKNPIELAKEVLKMEHKYYPEIILKCLNEDKS